VVAYALLLTDRYPPFRLNQGGDADGPIPPRALADDLQLASPTGS
jgi:hypothetical protein